MDVLFPDLGNVGINTDNARSPRIDSLGVVSLI